MQAVDLDSVFGEGVPATALAPAPVVCLRASGVAASEDPNIASLMKEDDITELKAKHEMYPCLCPYITPALFLCCMVVYPEHCKASPLCLIHTCPLTRFVAPRSTFRMLSPCLFTTPSDEMPGGVNMDSQRVDDEQAEVLRVIGM